MADLMIPTTTPTLKLTTPSSSSTSAGGQHQQQGVVGAITESSSVTESHHHNQHHHYHSNHNHHHHSPLLNLGCSTASSSSGGEETSSPSSNGTILSPHPQIINNGSPNNNNNGQQMDDGSSSCHNFSNNLNISSASSSPGASGGGLMQQQHSRNHSHPLIFSTSAKNNNVDSSSSSTTTGLSPEMALPKNISSTLPSSSSVVTMDILNLDFVNGNSSYSHQQQQNNAPAPLSQWPQQSHSTATKGDHQQLYRGSSSDPSNHNNNNCSQSTTLGSSTPGGDSSSANNSTKVVPGEIPESVMKYLLTKSDSVDSQKSSTAGSTPAHNNSSSGSTPLSSSEHQNKRLQEFLVDLDTIQSTSEIAKVLENFNAILERIEQEDDKEALEGLEALTTPLSPTVLQCPTATVSSTSRIKNSVETLADLLLSGCGDEEDEDLLIIIDENDSESLQAGAPQVINGASRERSLDVGILIERDGNGDEEGELEDDVSSLVEIETELGDLDQEEGYESDRPIVRASMRKLRPVKLLPMPSTSSSTHHHHHNNNHQHNNSNSSSNANNAFSTPPPTPVTPRACSPVDPSVGHGHHATSMNSPIANKIIVTSLMNNLNSSPNHPQSEIRTNSNNNTSDASSSSPASSSAIAPSTCSSAALSSALNSIVPTATLEVLHVSSASVPAGHSRNQSSSSQVIQFHQSPVTLSTNPTGFVEVSIGNPSGSNNNSQQSSSSGGSSNGQRVNGGNPNSTSGTLAGSSNSASSASNNVPSTECRAPPSTSSPACIPSSTETAPGSSTTRNGSNSNAASSSSGTASNGSRSQTTPTNSASNNATSNTTSNGGSRPRGRAPQAPSSSSQQQRGNSGSSGSSQRNPAGRWPHRLSSVLAVIGCTLGLNNICRFSLLSVQYGANFILQFIFLSVVFGIPLLTFHMSIGQYLSSGIIDMWKISPIFQGIGVGLVISQAMIGIYTTVGVSWIFIYFRDSFITRQDQYRWGKCIREFDECDPQFGNNTSVHMYNETVPGYFNAVVLQRTSPNYPDSAYVPSSLKFTVAFNLAVVWMLVFVSLSKGLKSYGKVVHGFVLAPVAALFVLAFKMVNLVPPGGSLFGQTKWSSFFFSSQTWVAAARETFFTWGLLGACVMQITAHNRHSHSLKSDSLIVIMVTMIVLMLSAFIGNACHSILTTSYYASPDTQIQFDYVPSSFESKQTYRFLEEVQSPSVEESQDMYDHHHISFLMGVRVIKQGTGSDFHQRSGYQVLRLATELFPATMAVQSQNGMSSFWTVLFYFAFVLFGIAQQIAIWHCVIKGIIAVKGKLLRSWETTITFFVCGLGFVLALPLCTETGIFIEYFMDYAIGSGWWIMVLYLLELIAVFIVRGAPYCGENIVTVLITGRNRVSAVLAPLISFIWNVIMPVAILVLSIASFKNGNIRELYDWNPKHGYRFWPSWTREVGSLIQLVPILAVPFVAILQSCRYLSTGPPDLFDRMQQLYRPNSAGLFGNNLSGSFNENGSDSGSSRNGNSSRGTEDPPPKYTPPPSYSTATGAKIAKFLRNSFRRSLRRLSSPGGPSTSSASPDNLPTPPNYASVILEINSQRNHQSSACAVSVVPGASSLMNPIMVPPPTYDESIRTSVPASSSTNRKNVDGNNGESSKLYQIQLSQTLGRSLAEGSRERASLRRIASDITSRDIARMLRQSLRRGATRDSPEASTSASAVANALTHGASSYSTNSSPGQGIIVTIPSLVESNGGNPREYTFGPNSIEKVEYDLEMLNDFSLQHDGQLPPNIPVPPSTSSAAHSRQASSSSTVGGNGAFGFNFSFNRARNRNSNDSQLALITNGVYEDLSVTSSGFMGALVDGDIEIDQFSQLNLPPRRDSLSQLNVLDLGSQGGVNPTFQITNANVTTTSSAGAGTTQVDRAADSEA